MIGLTLVVMSRTRLKMCKTYIYSCHDEIKDFIVQLLSQVLDPFHVLSDFGVDPRFVGTAASITPTSYTEKGISSLNLGYRWTSRITLTSVDLSGKVPGEKHTHADLFLAINLKRGYNNM